MPQMNRVLITGAAGALGTALRGQLKGVYPALRLTDIAPMPEAGAGEEVIQADLTDASVLPDLMRDVDGLLVFGGHSIEKDWDQILSTNIDALHALYMEAVAAGTQRIVFASSNHAIGFYHRDVPLKGSEPMRPDSRYGLSKSFGELLGQHVADRYGIGVMSIRIGSCFPKPTNARHLSTWMSQRDLAQLCRIGLETPELHNQVVWGISANTRGWWDNAAAFALGYSPQDNAEAYAEEVMALAVPEEGDALSLGLQGAGFASPDYRGDPDRVLKP